MIVSTCASRAQIEEKLWSQRRKSNEGPHPLGLHFTPVTQEDTVSTSSPVQHVSPLVQPRTLLQHTDNFNLATSQLEEGDAGIGHQAAASSGCEFCRLCISYEVAHCPCRVTDTTMATELRSLYQSLQKCLDLRDKYMRVSRQRLGDNPRDHDGVFHGLDEDLQDVTGVRPDAEYEDRKKPPRTFKPWTIYPPPPPPHWHWRDKDKTVEMNSMVNSYVEKDFEFDHCDIPGEDMRSFEVDERGVYQVYSDLSGTMVIHWCSVHV